MNYSLLEYSQVTMPMLSQSVTIHHYHIFTIVGVSNRIRSVNSLGLHVGSSLAAVRYYPFSRPVRSDQQQIDLVLPWKPNVD